MMNLKEATRLMREHALSPATIISNKELNDFVTDIQLAGKEILTSIPEDEFISALSLVQGMVMTDLLEDGNIPLALELIANMEQFQNIMVVALRCAVGLSEVEGWVK